MGQCIHLCIRQPQQVEGKPLSRLASHPRHLLQLPKEPLKRDGKSGDQETDILSGQSLQEAENFDPESTLFIDDNPSVLESARAFGISMLLNITRPDTRRPVRENHDFPTIEGVASLIG